MKKTTIIKAILALFFLAALIGAILKDDTQVDNGSEYKAEVSETQENTEKIELS